MDSDDDGSYSFFGLINLDFEPVPARLFVHRPGVLQAGAALLFSSCCTSVRNSKS